jgi:hypothetical protein
MKRIFVYAAFLITASASAHAELHPIVQAETGFLIGASSEGRWLESEEAAKALRPGVGFRLFGLQNEMTSAKAGKTESAGEPCPDTQVVELSPKPPRDAAVGIAAPWKVLPRSPRLEKVQKHYEQAVREFLENRGLREPEVKITQTIRVDLEGDGEEEVLISATNYSATKDLIPSSAPAGSYSVVLLRRVTNGKVITQMIEGEFYPQAKEFNAPSAYRVAAVLDLNGDGALEVVIDGAYYEGAWMAVYVCTPGQIKKVLSAGCGA